MDRTQPREYETVNNFAKRAQLGQTEPNWEVFVKIGIFWMFKTRCFRTIVKKRFFSQTFVVFSVFFQKFVSRVP